jgi:hypothetical protein
VGGAKKYINQIRWVTNQKVLHHLLIKLFSFACQSKDMKSEKCGSTFKSEISGTKLVSMCKGEGQGGREGGVET